MVKASPALRAPRREYRQRRPDSSVFALIVAKKGARVLRAREWARILIAENQK